MTYHVSTALLALVCALPTHAFADWNGAYAGFSFGSNTTNNLSTDVDFVSVSADVESSYTLGVFGGYNVQNGNYVFGGEVAVLRAPDLAFEINDVEVLNTDFDILDLKGRVGYAVNNVLFFGVAGFSIISEGTEDADGFNYGVGADLDFGNNFVIGTEYLVRRASDDEVDFDFELDTFALRAAFRF